jgi:hypothetical protein
MKKINVYKKVFMFWVVGGMMLVFQAKAQETGCTDPLAINFSSIAVINDGSCLYEKTVVSPQYSIELPSILEETSGLIWWEDKLWTHNDSKDTLLYGFSPEHVQNLSSYALKGLKNNDWEELAQDETHLYLGDFGNNAAGNRTDLSIFKIDKTLLKTGVTSVERIHFQYGDQTDFSNQGPNNTDFDCEAMVVLEDSIYLFTKQWVSGQSNIYVLPKTAGNHVARPAEAYNVEGLITGASHLPGRQVTVLCGYSTTLEPFVLLLYDYNGRRFFSGNKRKIDIQLPFHQVEAIATKDGLIYDITNELFSRFGITVKAGLHQLDLSSYLQHDVLLHIEETGMANAGLRLYPNPFKEDVFFMTEKTDEKWQYHMVDFQGKGIKNGEVGTGESIGFQGLKPGKYSISFTNKTSGTTVMFHVIKAE